MSFGKMTLKQMDYIFCLGSAMKGKRGTKAKGAWDLVKSQMLENISGWLTTFGRISTLTVPLSSWTKVTEQPTMTQVQGKPQV